MPTIPERLETATAAAEAAVSTLTTATSGASSSATAAASSATSAASSASAAASSASGASTAQTAAEAAQSAAETAQTASETAQTGAETAQSAAATSASAAASNASAASGDAASALSSKTAAETAQTAAETAQTASEAAQSAAETAETNAAASANAAAASATTASSSATAAAASAQDAVDTLIDLYTGTVAGNAVPATASAAGRYYRISSAGTSQSITWAVGDIAIYSGTSGVWTKVPMDTYGFAVESEIIEALAVPLLPYPALRFDGANGTRAYQTLNDQSWGDGDGAQKITFIYPQDVTSDHKVIWARTSSISEVTQTKALVLAYNTGFGFALQFLNSASMTADVRRLASTTVHDELEALGAAGVPVTIFVQRRAGVISIFKRVGNGPVTDITSDFSESTNGSPPAWSDTVNDDYTVLAYRRSTTSSAVDVLDARSYNVAAADLDEAAEMMAGNVPAKWAKGDSLVNRTTIANGTGGRDFPTFTGASATGFTGETAASGFTRVHAGFSVSVKTGDQFRVTYDYTRNSGTPIGEPIQIVASSSTTTSKSNSHQSVEGTGNEAILTATDTGTFFLAFAIAPNNGTTNGTWANIQIEKLGVTAALDLQDGGGYQPKNPRFENGSTHWTMTTSGVTWAVPAQSGKRIAITKTFTHDQISSTPGTTLHGYRPAGWAIRETQIRKTTTFDASTVLDIGSSGTANLFADNIDLTGTGSGRQASLSEGSSSTDDAVYLTKNQATTQGEVTVTVILERAF